MYNIMTGSRPVYDAKHVVVNGLQAATLAHSLSVELITDLIN